MAKSPFLTLRWHKFFFTSLRSLKIGIFLWAPLTCVPSLKKKYYTFLSYRVHKEISTAAAAAAAAAASAAAAAPV